MREVPVVAISGHPGSGKTTLTRALAEHFGAPALFYDDFETITSKPPAQIAEWMARGSDYDEIDLAALIDAVAEARLGAPRLIVVDTLLGRAHSASGALIGLSLWIDAPPDIALARKLRDASEQVGDSAADALDFARWVRGYTTHYERFIAQTYRTQVERVRSRADVILPLAGPGQVLQSAIRAIEEGGL